MTSVDVPQDPVTPGGKLESIVAHTIQRRNLSSLPKATLLGGESAQFPLPLPSCLLQLSSLFAVLQEGGEYRALEPGDSG